MSSMAAPDELQENAPALSHAAQESASAVEGMKADSEVDSAREKLAAAAETTAPKKALFWSAALNPVADAGTVAEPDQSHVPPVLRSLHKCDACGFPVSAGRVLCVECEEKKWRGQLRLATPRRGATPGPGASATVAKPEVRAFAAGAQSGAASATAPARQSLSAAVVTPGRDATPLTAVKSERSKEVSGLPVVALSTSNTAAGGLVPATDALENRSPVSAPEFVFSAGLQPSQSWLAANKYIVGVILLVGAAGAAAFFLLH